MGPFKIDLTPTSLCMVSRASSCTGKKMDTATIERLASKVQLRIKDALATTSEEGEVRQAPPTQQGGSTAAPGGGRVAGMYRKILPNTSKATQQLPSPQAPPLTPQSHAPSLHVRTPGVVTVQVCSSIPASLTLSSITNPTAPNLEGGEGNGGPNGPSGTPSGNSGYSGGVEWSLDSSRKSCSSSSSSPSVPAIIKPRGGVVTGGGNVMVTPLSPTVLPAVRTVAQIVTVSKSVTPKQV